MRIYTLEIEDTSWRLEPGIEGKSWTLKRRAEFGDQTRFLGWVLRDELVAVVHVAFFNRAADGAAAVADNHTGERDWDARVRAHARERYLLEAWTAVEKPSPPA